MSTEFVSAPVALVTGADKGIGLAANADGPPPRPSAQFLELDMTSDESVRHAAGSVEQTGAPGRTGQ